MAKNKLPTSPLICPICKNYISLNKESNSYQCTKKHSFDIAKQGYINLLVSNQKKSQNPGESKEMIRVRRDFLKQGFYKPISDQLNQLIWEQLNKPKHSILDLGCGEGYYLDQCISFIEERQTKNQRKNNSYYGLDISKEALKLAGARKSNATFIVASNFNTPFKAKSMDVILSVFSPISDDEIHRLLGDDGVFIRVLPNANHLIELREIIYDTTFERREGTINPKNLTIDSETNMTYSINLTQENIILLLQMTPHYWKTSPQNQEKIHVIDSLDITIDMNITLFKKYF